MVCAKYLHMTFDPSAILSDGSKVIRENSRIVNESNKDGSSLGESPWLEWQQQCG